MTKTQKESRTNRKTYKVLIVDDHPIVRHGLGQLIADDPKLEVIGGAESVNQALKMIEKELPDVVVIDITLENSNGVDLIKQIKAKYENSIKMLVSTMHDESMYAERALHAGAMGYINKQESISKVVKAIHHILSGKLYLSPTLSDKMLQQMVDPDYKPTESPIDRLTDRELEVFEFIGSGKGTREIAEQMNLSIKTIETHRENIKRKLSLKTNNALIRYAVQWQAGET